MIIVMTNRRLNSPPVDEPARVLVDELGVELGDEGARLYTGLLSERGKSIEFYPRGQETQLFDSISAEERARPWVVFLHGFHQDPDENIEKARKLHDRHRVNVIAFAWPSRPLDQDYDLSDAAKDALKSLVRGANIPRMLGTIATNAIKENIKDLWNNYEPARSNASNSVNDFATALQMVEAHLTPARPPVLLVHSMGNFLLKQTVKTLGGIPGSYSNIVLHQADVNSADHRWVTELNNNLDSVNAPGSALYVTINEIDSTLAASHIRRIVELRDKRGRLGRTRKDYIVGDVNYLDFSDGPKIDADHEMFKRSRSYTNAHVFDCLSRLFRGEDSALPQTRKEKKSGFTRMPTDISLWWLTEIIDPTSDGMGSDWDDNTTGSLNFFQDPLEKNSFPEDEPEDSMV